MAVLLLFSACSSSGADADSHSEPRAVPAGPSQPAPSPVLPSQATGEPSVSQNNCPPLPALAPLPKRFPDFPLPKGTVSIEPAAQPAKGLRADFFVPVSVTETQKFFLRQVRKGGLQLAFTENEGFESEVYFEMKDGKAALVRILLTCHDGSIISFEVFPPS